MGRTWRSVGKWSLAAATAGGMLTALSASPVAYAKAAPVTIRVLTWDSGTGLDVYKQFVSAFEKEYPNIHVDIQSDTSSYYTTKLLTELATGSAPDVFLVPDNAATAFAESGRVLDLAPLFKAHQFGLNASHFYKNVLDIGKIKGDYYFVPKDWADEAVLYNKTLFKKAHLPFPKKGWTLQQFIQDAQKLTIQKSGRTVQWGAQLPGTWLRAGLEYMAAAYGGKLISPKGDKATGYLTSKNTEHAIAEYLDLYNKYHLSPSPSEVSAFGNIDLFSTQRVGMEWTGPWNVGQYRTDKKLDFGIAPMPIGPTHKQVSEAFWAGWAIYKNTPHLKQAEQLLGFFASQKYAIIDGQWAMPGLKGAAVKQVENRDPQMKTYFGQANYLAPMEPTWTTNWPKDVNPPLTNMIETAIQKPSTNVQKLIEQTAKQIDKNLASEKH